MLRQAAARVLLPAMSRRLSGTVAGRGGAVSVANIKALRKQTSLPVLVCRQALAESGDSIDAALDWIASSEDLKAKSQKLQTRATSEGRIAMALGVAGSPAGALVEVHCETDFVARNEQFESLAAALAEGYLTHEPARAGLVSWDGAESCEAVGLAAGGTAKDAIQDAISSIAENIAFSRATRLGVAGPGGVVGGYVHNFGSYAALVSLEGVEAGDAQAQDVARQLAQHVVAMDPSPDADYADGAAVQALLDQPFLLHTGVEVGAFLAKAAPSATVASFLRWSRG